MKEESKPKAVNTENPPTKEAAATETPPKPGGDEKKKKSPKQGYDYNVHVIKVSLDNAEKPGAFANHILKYGFDAARLAEGRALLEHTLASRLTQLNAIAEKRDSYRIIRELKEVAKKKHRHIRILGKEGLCRQSPTAG